MIPVDRWDVYYADGSVFSSEEGTWAEAPPFGVIAIVYYNTAGRLTQEVGRDISVYEHPGIKPTHVVEIEEVPVGMGVPVKMGLWTDRESYWRVHDLARRRVTPTP